MALHTRLAVAVAAIACLLITAGGLLFLHQLERGLDKAVDNALRARADALIAQLGPDGGTGFQDAGADGLLPPDQALAQVVSRTGVLLESSEGATARSLLTKSQLQRAQSGPVSITSLLSATSVRLLALPLPGSGQPPTVVVVGTTRAIPQQAVARVRAGLVLGGLAAIALCGGGAWLLAGVALRPVERMRQQAEAITAGTVNSRLSVPATRDEVARLGTTMNGLLQRLQESLTRQRHFTADAGHELRTPLTYLRTELELAGRPGRTRQQLQAAVSRAADDTERLVRLTEDLLLLASADQPSALLQRAPVRLDSIAAQAAAAARPTAANSNVTIGLEAPRPVVVDADPARLRQILDNLLDNAVRFAPPGSTIQVRATNQAATGLAVLDVSDQGPGFPADFLPHAFERFRRADPSRTPGERGSGLGLAIVKSLTEVHGGTVTATNEPWGGAHLHVELPLTRHQPSPAQPGKPA